MGATGAAGTAGATGTDETPGKGIGAAVNRLEPSASTWIGTTEAMRSSRTVAWTGAPVDSTWRWR
ncbi:hypothetical protein [Streptomyces sp. RerS4]|uniref:hypothetical protein n=1 Tax=Streptomyces sp. RerS4 TaxID=2942449 RepID=UPI00201C0CD9|nr:hypothetical protein [Streptomyces sp. RerS4]UQX02514.1 hypothetical protein M4D82_19990 [Streptomyces sp. RerS4]